MGGHLRCLFSFAAVGEAAFLDPRVSPQKTAKAEEIKQFGDKLAASPVPTSIDNVIQKTAMHQQVPLGQQVMAGSGPAATAAGSAVPVPELGAVPLPPAFSRTLRDRIFEDSRRLGSAAESLLAIQSDINRVQTEVQGKVFDLETVRGFFSTHQYLSAEAETCKATLARKDELLASMGAELHETEQLYHNATMAMEARMKEAELKATTASQEEKSIEAEYLGSKKSILEDEKLRAENADLVDKLKRASELAVQNSRDRKTIEELEAADKAHKELVQQLQSSVHMLQDQVQNLQDSDKQKDVALVDHVEELKKAAKVSQEQAKVHIATAEHDKATLAAKADEMQKHIDAITEENKKLKDGIASVQYQAVRKFEAMKATIGKYKESVQSLRESVSQNIVARKKEEAEVNRLTQLLVKSDAETLKQTLDNVKLELKETHARLEEMTVAKSKAEADLLAEASARAAADKIAANEKVAAEKARQETIDRVALCEKQKAEELGVANKNFQTCTTKLNSLSEEKCGERWRELNAESLEKLEQCKVTEEALKTCDAEKEVLKSAATGKLCGDGVEAAVAGAAGAGADAAAAATEAAEGAPAEA